MVRIRTLTNIISLLAGLSALPAHAVSFDPAAAEAEVRRLRAELAQAEAVAEASREIEAARREAEAANRRIAAAQARLTTVQAEAAPAPGAATLGAREKAIAEKIAEAAAEKVLEEKAQNEFAGLEFGVGISYTHDIGENDRIADAELVNGIVRVSDEDNGRARIMLESHFFFTPNGTFFNLPAKQWGVGPFIALQPGTDDIIEAIALGLMFGFRHDAKKSESFNIGFGLVIDPNTQILGDGIIANQPLPEGETEIRFKEEAQRGVMMLASFSF